MKNKELFNEKMKLIGSLILRIILYYIVAVLFYIVVLDNLLGNFLGNTLYRFNYNLYEWCVYNKEPIFLFYMIIILVIALYRFFSKKVDNIEKLYKSFDNILNEETQNIELPNEMTRFSEKLNKIKYEYILSTKRAKEAEQKKNDLIMYMAHDLKTPLTSVIGYLSLLNEEQEISKKLQNKYIKIALDKALRVEELTNQFFEITRYNLNDIPLNKTNIDLVMLLNQLVEEFYPMLEERNLKLNITKPNILMYNADGDKLARAFGNLLKNAISYSYENTTITINMIENEENIYQKNIEELNNEINKIKSENNMQNNLEEYKIINKYEKNIEKNEINFLLKKENLNIDISIVENEINDLRYELNKLEVKKENIGPQLENLSSIEEQTILLKQQLENLEQKNESIELVKVLLSRAYENMKNSVSPVFTEKLSKNIANITKGKYCKLNFSDENGLIVELENGNYIPAERLSIGTIDQLYLSLRLAMLDEVSNEKVPIILDEAFAFFDNERLKNILLYLSEEFKNRQIIILTCTNREKEILNNENINYNYVEL